MSNELGVINDAIFSYSLISLLFQILSLKIDIFQISIYSFMLTTILAYIEPFDNMVKIIAIKNIIKMGGKPENIFKKAYETSYLKNLRFKTKTGFYVIIILSLFIPLKEIPPFPIPNIIALIAILIAIYKIVKKYYSNIILGILAVSKYISLIPRLSDYSTTNISILDKIRQALENENWIEAFHFIENIKGTNTVKIPDKIRDKIYEYLKERIE